MGHGVKSFLGWWVKAERHDLHFGPASARLVRHRTDADEGDQIKHWVYPETETGQEALDHVRVDSDDGGSAIAFDAHCFFELDLPDRQLIRDIEVRCRNDQGGTDNLRFTLQRVGVATGSAGNTSIADGVATVIEDLAEVEVSDTGATDHSAHANYGDGVTTPTDGDRVRRDLYSYRLRCSYLGNSVTPTTVNRDVFVYWVRVTLEGIEQ